MAAPTSSMFHAVLAKGKEGRMRKVYMYKLAGERLTGEPMDMYTNSYMERGHEMEPDARNLYALMHDAEPELVGFIKRGEEAGCSPDSLIGEDGLLEIKTALPHILIEYILKDEFPPAHKAQCQGALWVSGRQWIDIAVYWPSLPLFVKRAARDEDYITALAGEVARFNTELAEIVEKVRRAG